MDSILHVVLGNALVATVLALLAAGSTLVFRRPALSHALWTLVLLKLITPSFIQVPIPGYTSYHAAEARMHRRPRSLARQRSAAARRGRRPRLPPGRVPPNDLRRVQPLPRVPLFTVFARRQRLPGAKRSSGSRSLAAWRGLPGWGFAFAGSTGCYARPLPAPAELVREVERWAGRIGLRRCPQVLLCAGRSAHGLVLGPQGKAHLAARFRRSAGPPTVGRGVDP